MPANRMKAGKEHRVPLSARAIEIIQSIKREAGKEILPAAFVFQGAKRGKPLSNMAFLMLLRRMDRSNVTAHGFRSTFRDWVAERTNYPGEVAEMALAHTVSNQVEAAYRRSDCSISGVASWKLGQPSAPRQRECLKATWQRCKRQADILSRWPWFKANVTA